MPRFFRRGISVIGFSLDVADKATPTRAEIDGMTDLTPETADVTGFQLENSPINTPDLRDAFTSQIDGEDTTADSSLTFYDLRGEDGPSPARTALPKGTNGFILLLPYGDVEGDRMEVWPVRSTGVNDEWSMGNDPARFVVGFAITGLPEQDAVIPAPAV